MVGVACITGGQGCIFYLLYQIGECGVGHHWRLFVTITPLLRSIEGTYHGQVCLLRMWCCQCLLHLSYVLAICVYCGAWSSPSAVYVLAILCIVGCLVCIWCKRGVVLVKFQTFPISYGVTGHKYILWDMYALT